MGIRSKDCKKLARLHVDVGETVVVELLATVVNGVGFGDLEAIGGGKGSNAV